MKVYVDGTSFMNHLEAQGDTMAAGGGSEKDRQELARWFARYAEHQDCDVILVFDENPFGRTLPKHERYGKTKVINTPPGENARAEIAGPANRDAESERVYVVTDDGRLYSAVQNSPVRAYSPGKFLSKARTLMRGKDELQTEEPDEKYTGVSEDEVDFWLEMYKDENGDEDL